MLHRLFITIQVFYTIVFFSQQSLVGEGEVLGAQTGDVEQLQAGTDFKPQLETTTAFNQREEERYETIPYEIIYEDDEDMEYGLEEILQPGVEGRTTYKYLITYWGEDIIDEVLLDTAVEEPTTQIVSRGKKIVWKTIDTPEYGEIKYWFKMRVWATKYDSTCLGCNNTTALGAPVKQGVCAVDPTVIDMYTHFYVPGYGKCQALDVGGAIKGNKIDLAYEDHTKGSWRTGYTDIYLMDNEPQ